MCVIEFRDEGERAKGRENRDRQAVADPLSVSGYREGRAVSSSMDAWRHWTVSTHGGGVVCGSGVHEYAVVHERRLRSSKSFCKDVICQGCVVS